MITIIFLPQTKYARMPRLEISTAIFIFLRLPSRCIKLLWLYHQFLVAISITFFCIIQPSGNPCKRCAKGCEIKKEFTAIHVVQSGPAKMTTNTVNLRTAKQAHCSHYFVGEGRRSNINFFQNLSAEVFFLRKLGSNSSLE